MRARQKERKRRDLKDKMQETLWLVCSEGKVVEVIQLLQNSQININWQNHSEHKRTPFYIACRNGRIEAVKLLLNVIE